MGNGGCNCNVQNFNVVNNPAKIKIIKNVRINFHDIVNINRNDVYEIFDKEIDFNFCESYSIGPFFLKNVDFNKELANKFLLHKNEFLELIKNNYLSEIIYQDIISQNTTDQLISEFDNREREKVANLFYYNWDNSIRVALYNIFMPSEYHPTVVSSEKLILLDNVLNINKNEELAFQIERDVQRTFPQQVIFNEKAFCNNLTNCLLKIALVDTELGYVQGMNFMVAYLLILTGNQPDITNNFFLRIMNLKSALFDRPFREVLTEKFELMYLYIDKFMQILRIHDDQIFRILKKYEISEFLWISKWIQTLFTFKFKFELVSKFLDLIVIKGVDCIILIILAIVEFFSCRIKKIKSIEEFLQICDDIYEIKGYSLSSFIIFIINKIKSEEYKRYLIH